MTHRVEVSSGTSIKVYKKYLFGVAVSILFGLNGSLKDCRTCLPACQTNPEPTLNFYSGYVRTVASLPYEYSRED